MDMPRLLVMAPLAALLATAAIVDLRSRLIPNPLTAAVAMLAIGWWLADGESGAMISIHLLTAAAALALFGTLFAVGMMGGGDVKLIAALALWLPPLPFVRMLVWMALAGGVLTVVMLILHRAREGRPEIPYGVAIVAAAFLVLANDILTTAAA